MIKYLGFLVYFLLGYFTSYAVDWIKSFLNVN